MTNDSFVNKAYTKIEESVDILRGIKIIEFELFKSEDESSAYIDLFSQDKSGRMTIYEGGYVDIEIISSTEGDLFEHFEGVVVDDIPGKFILLHSLVTNRTNSNK